MSPRKGIPFYLLFLYAIHIYALNIPHLVYGTVRYDDGSIPPSVTFDAYVTTRPSDILSESDFDCHYQSGSWQVQVGNFDNNWKVGDIVHVDFDDGSDKLGSNELRLSADPGDNGRQAIVNTNTTGKLSMPDTTFSRGNVESFPIKLSGLGVPDSVVAYEVTVGFDPEVVEAVDATSAGTMTVLWGAPFVGPKHSAVTIAGFTTNQPSKQLLPDLGILVKVRFLIHGDPGDPVTYQSDIFIKNAIIYTLDATYVISDFKNGSITVINNPSNSQKSITLYPNWNQISLGLSPEPNTIPEVFGGLNVTFVFAYGSKENKRKPLTWSMNRPVFVNDLTYLDAIHGYDIKLDDASSQTWQFSGDAIDASTPIVLYPNWNLIGYLPGSSALVATALSTIDPFYAFVMGSVGGVEDGTRSWSRSRPAFANDLVNLDPLSGYWIKMDSAATLNYAGGVPKTSPIISKTEAAQNSTDQGMVSYLWCDFWAYQFDNLSVGDTINAFDSDGVCCGSTIVLQDNSGKVGFNVHVFGDDPATTEVDEGAEEGDTITFLRNNKIVTILGTSDSHDTIIDTNNFPIWSYRGSFLVQMGKQVASNIQYDKHQLHDFQLSQNYPNPFNPETVIPYYIKSQSQVRLCVINVRGEIIRTLVNEKQTSGSYQVVWDSRNDHGMTVSGGIYFVRLQAGNQIQTHKCLLVK